MAKLWGGRFTKGTDKAVEDFTSSIAFDARMYAEDIAGSKAHATCWQNKILSPTQIGTLLLRA